MSEYRQLFYNAVAKLGAANTVDLMRRYDDLTAKFGEDKAIDMLHAAFVQLNNHAKGSVDCKSLLTPAAKTIFEALDGKTLTVESSLVRLKKLQEKIKAREGKELDVEIGNPRLRIGLLETQENYKANGILERTKIFKSIASATHPKVTAGLELTVVFSR